VLRRVGEVNYELYMRKRRAIFHVNMLKKWYQPDGKCLWAEEVVSEEEDDMPSWRGKKGKSPSVGTQLTEQQKNAKLKSVMNGKCGRASVCEHHIRTRGGLPERLLYATILQGGS